MDNKEINNSSNTKNVLDLMEDAIRDVVKSIDNQIQIEILNKIHIDISKFHLGFQSNAGFLVAKSWGMTPHDASILICAELNNKYSSLANFWAS